MRAAAQPLRGGSNGTLGVSRKRKHSTMTPSTSLSLSTSLPIHAHRQSIIDALQTSDTLVLVGETGSGKTTQLPQFLHESSIATHGVIACTQPRRVAAISVATRVTSELAARAGRRSGSEVGGVVGYSVRFDDRSSPLTRILYITDGMILRETLVDPLLARYSVICIDEAHERSLNTDTLMALCKSIQHKRRHHPSLRPLKMIVMSATLDAQSFSDYFDSAPIIHVSGRQYPVSVMYTMKPEPDLIDATVTTVLQLHLTADANADDGDVLAFLPGQEEIDSVCAILREKSQQLVRQFPGKKSLVVLPLYAALSQEQQMLVFAPTPSDNRKVIVSTNIAETSVTLPNIVHVIDSGVTKTRIFDSHTNIDSLSIVDVSQAEGWQRAGRAGRVKPGRCYRLYTEKKFESLASSRMPEIQRTNLVSTLLWLKAMGVPDVASVDWMNMPNKLTVNHALSSLLMLGAIHSDGSLTPLGHSMSKFPLEPLYARALLLSCHSPFHCSKEMVEIVSMLNVEQIFIHNNSKSHVRNDSRNRLIAKCDGDHLALMLVYQDYEKQLLVNNSRPKLLSDWCRERGLSERGLVKARQIHQQLTTLMETMGLPLVSATTNNDSDIANVNGNGGGSAKSYDIVRQCLCASMQSQLARRSLLPNLYVSVADQSLTLAIHPSSLLHSRHTECDYLVYDEIVRTTKQYMRTCTKVDAGWVLSSEKEWKDSHRVKSQAVYDRLAKLPDINANDDISPANSATNNDSATATAPKTNVVANGHAANGSAKSTKRSANSPTAVGAAIANAMRKKARVVINAQ